MRTGDQDLDVSRVRLKRIQVGDKSEVLSGKRDKYSILGFGDNIAGLLHSVHYACVRKS
jgi:hypothetical protein